MASTSVRDSVQAFLTSEEPACSSQIPSELAQLIAQHQANLLQVVRASGEWLTAEEDIKRGRAIGLLAHIIAKCPREAVTRQEARTLADFFASSLTSSNSDEVLVPTLEGLTALAKLPSFTSTDTVTVCRNIFLHIELVGRPQSTRYLFYCLIDVFMAHQRKALMKMGKEFLKGYTTVVTGEKDPRNLRLAFSIAKVILVEFDIQDNVEDLFDIVFCYFPITFTPPPNDPYGITSEQLQASLRECLAATPRFGPLALPLLLEKLQASTSSAKRQTLQALVACFPVYGQAVTLSHAVAYWESFSIEIFHASDSEMEERSLEALQALLATIYPDIAGQEDIQSDSAAMKVARKMSEQCLLELNECDKSNATPATKILSRALAASASLARFLAPMTFGHLLKIYRSPEHIAQRPAIFEVMSSLLKGLRNNAATNPADSVSSLREELLSIATSGMKTGNTQTQALDCLIQLIQVPNCLTPQELVFALSSVTDLLIQTTSNAEDETSEEAATAALEGLSAIAPLYPSAIQEIVLPRLFELLPQEAPAKQDAGARNGYRLALASLASLCSLPQLTEVFLVRLLSRLDGLFGIFINSGSQYVQTVIYSHHLLVTLRIVCKGKVEAKHGDLTEHADRLVRQLLRLFIVPSVRPTSTKVVATEPKLIQDAAELVSILTQQMGAELQTTLSGDLRAAFLRKDLKDLLVSNRAPLLAETNFQPFSIDAPKTQRNLTVLFASAIHAVRKEALGEPQGISELCFLLLEHLPSWAADMPFEGLCKLLASLVNKRAEDLTGILDNALLAFWDDRIVTASEPLQSRRAALKVYAWTMRGLAVRSDSRAYEGVSRLISVFSDKDLSSDAARTMSILSKDADGVLVKENFANIKLLHKQRFFAYVLPLLVDGQKGSGSEQATPYLVGLSCLLQSMPRQTAVNEMPKLLPLLLRALDLPELDLRAHVIDTFSLLVQNSPDTFKDQIPTIVSALLENALCSDPSKDTEAGIELRLASLRCLAVLPDKFEWLVLHQQKTPVLKALGSAIDDHKKVVRKEAVDCRAKWFLFKAP